MPELPEVESLRHFLGERLRGLQVARAELAAISALKTFDPPLDALVGRTIAGAGRQGKYICLESTLDGDEPLFLVMHLARGGWVQWREELKPGRAKIGSKGPLALKLGFSDGSGIDVTEAGTEKRLAAWVVRDPQSVEQVATLGPDPLSSDMDAQSIGALMRAGTGQIKKVLTDQRVLAGVGNAYSDEALHVAKLSPFRKAEKLTEEEAVRLGAAVIEVLQDAVARSADVPVSGLKSEKKSGLRVHGRAGQPCPICGDTVAEVSFATKSLQYCPTCQTGGKPLADRRMSRLLK
jgi:formamidopyrimidine-DNA glycosylase